MKLVGWIRAQKGARAWLRSYFSVKGKMIYNKVMKCIEYCTLDSLEAVEKLQQEWPNFYAGAFTAFDDDEDLFEAIKNGAVGYILKNVKAEEFIELLSGVMRGEVAVSPWIASKIVGELFRNPGRLAAKHADSDLTTKEEEVLRLVADGAANKDIASSLNISENTVKYHLRNIMEKLHFKNRAQMAVYAAKRGIEPVRPEEKR